MSRVELKEWMEDISFDKGLKMEKMKNYKKMFADSGSLLSMYENPSEFPLIPNIIKINEYIQSIHNNTRQFKNMDQQSQKSNDYLLKSIEINFTKFQLILPYLALIQKCQTV